MINRRFMQSKKKNSFQEERVIHDEEFGEENVQQVDEEWAEFEKVLREFRERRFNSSKEKNVQKKKGKKKVRTQMFYPCPPPSMSEQDNYSDDEDDDDENEADRSSDDGFVSTLVSKNLLTIYVCMHTYTH